MSSSQSHPLKGWHARSTPHDFPHDYSPTRDALKFILLYNAPVEQEGFTVALFAPNIAIDAVGSVRFLSSGDFTGLVNMAERVRIEAPETGTFRNTWVLDHKRTSQPIDRVLLLSSSDSPYTGSLSAEDAELVNIASVQGYQGDLRRLKRPVAGLEVLPEVLGEFVGLGREGREGWKSGEEDRVVLGKVREVLGNVW